MTKKDIIFPIVFVGLSLVFVLASLLVYFSKGKSAVWVNRKMKIGALLLGLSAVTYSCRPRWTCYAAPTPNIIYIKKNNNSNQIVINHRQRTIKGTINMRESESFSYSIAKTDSASTVLYKANLFPFGKKLVSETENFTIEIPSTIESGKYNLLIFTSTPEEQENYYYCFSTTLIIE